MEDYKKSLLLPITTFSMKANLGINEPVMQQKWLENRIYEKKLLQNQNNSSYIFLDGPPYANGNLHIGHAFNKILKDFNIRFRNYEGKYCPFILGWDTHGLPIENAMEKKGLKKDAFNREEFNQKCKEYAIEQIKIQKDQFKSFGLFTNYETTYFTFSKDYEYAQMQYFYNMVSKNLIYQNFKPIYWSWSSESALAEAEVEYSEKKSASVYVKFTLTKNKYLPENSYLVIWTTTPWTLSGNQAVAINQNFEYILVSDGKENLIVAKDLWSSLSIIAYFSHFKILKTLITAELIKLMYTHPIHDLQTCPIVFGDHVTLESGTGLVHTAPAHGMDDFLIGKKYNLPIIPVINKQGVLINSGKFDKMFYLKVEPLIIEHLQEKKLLAHATEILHQYPHDWRTKKPIVYLATLQWFVSIEKVNQKILKNLKTVKTYPDWGKPRLESMITGRNEWCISRQRYWGVPIAIFFDEKKIPVLNNDIFEHLLEIFQKEGTSVWYTWNNNQLLPKKYHKQSSLWTKETDIMDVWFDSGTAFSQIKKLFPTAKQADLFLEGNDQFRGWFNSSLIISTIVNNKSPYKTLLSHGFTLDAHGNKMSKSKGNTVDPIAVTKKYGADILRLWVATTNFQEDVKISENSLAQTSEAYRKIRNTMKFILGNLNDFDFKKNKAKQLLEIDELILAEFAIIFEENITNYKQFKYEKIISNLLNFIINKLSGFYLDFAKDILYINKANDLRRRQIQTTLYYILEIIMHSFWPILPHTIEEAYKCFPNKSLEISFALEKKINVKKFVKKWKQEWKNFWPLQKDVLKALEIARSEKVIGKSLEAQLIYELKPEYAYFNNWNLQELFMVSDILVANVSEKNMQEYKTCNLKVNAYSHHSKCSRCWKHFQDDQMANDLVCKHCYEVVHDASK